MKFDDEHVREFLHLARAALFAEDTFMKKAFESPGNPYRATTPPGVLWLENERYYQFVIARYLVSFYSSRVELEWGPELYDLAIIEPATGNGRPVAVVEIKRWFSSSGEPELRGMGRDIDKLRKFQNTGLLLVISSNPRGQCKENASWLEKRLRERGATQPDDRLLWEEPFATQGLPRVTDGWSDSEVWVAAVVANAPK